MKLQYQGREYIVTQTNPLVAICPTGKRTLEILRIGKAGIITQTRKLNFDMVGVAQCPVRLNPQ